MEKNTKETIEGILRACISGALKRTLKNKVHRPFHESLLSKEYVMASSFERSFSTSFGQGPVEEISRLIAIDAGYEAQRQKQTLVNIYKGAMDEVYQICSNLRSGETRPDWERETAKLKAYSKGDTLVIRVISDLWLQKDGIETFISIKTVKPNLGQTEHAKKDVLLLKAHNPEYQTYFGLFYNPGGPERADYNWTMPMKIFDMHNDEAVLIGKDYWNKLGGDETTYEELLKIFEKVGAETRPQLTKL